MKSLNCGHGARCVEHGERWCCQVQCVAIEQANLAAASNKLAVGKETIHGKYVMQAQCQQGQPVRTTQRQQVTPRSIYVIGSLRNPNIPVVAAALRASTGLRVFDDWYSAGPNADDHWKEYEQARGRDYISALAGAAAKNVYAFDKRHLEAATDVVLVLPAGKSGHLELGFCAGRGKRTYILLEAGVDPRWDVMYKFADAVVESVSQLGGKINAQ